MLFNSKIVGLDVSFRKMKSAVDDKYLPKAILHGSRFAQSLLRFNPVEQQAVLRQFQLPQNQISKPLSNWIDVDVYMSQLGYQLLQAGAYVNQTTQRGLTALMLAAESRLPYVVETFINHDADITITDASNTNALMFASYGGDVTTASLLLDCGLGINTFNRWGKTPLLLAVLNNHAAMVQFLLSKGADPYRVSYGTRLADFVKNNSQQFPEIYKLFKDSKIIRNLLFCSRHTSSIQGIFSLHKSSVWRYSQSTWIKNYYACFGFGFW